MSIRKERIGMLVSLKSTLGDIEHDAENQDEITLKSNMVILQKHVADILKLDGIFGISPTSKVDK